jgi:hypothetical protein
MSLSSRYNMVAADLMSSKCSEKSRLGGLLWMGRVEHNSCHTLGRPRLLWVTGQQFSNCYKIHHNPIICFDIGCA